MSIFTASGLATLKKTTPSSGGGGGSYALVAHISKALGAAGGTSDAIDTTGATLAIIGVVSYTAIGSVSDSKGNTWTPLTLYGDAGTTRQARFYYCVNPTVGSGHTFSTSGTLTSIFVLAFSGNAATPFDRENGAGTDGTTTFQPGSVTPSQANEIVVSMVGYFSSDVNATINSGFTRVDVTDFNSGSNLAGAIAWKQQTSATSENPTWTIGSSADGVANIATFE